MQSQVTAGGIDVRDIDPEYMESKLIPVFILQVKLWMWTEIAEGLTYSGHGLLIYCRRMFI